MRAKDAKTSKRVCLVRDGRVPQQDTRKRGRFTVEAVQARDPMPTSRLSTVEGRVPFEGRGAYSS